MCDDAVTATHVIALIIQNGVQSPSLLELTTAISRRPDGNFISVVKIHNKCPKCVGLCGKHLCNEVITASTHVVEWKGMHA